MLINEDNVLRFLHLSGDLYWQADQNGILLLAINSEKFKSDTLIGKPLIELVTYLDDSNEDRDLFFENFTAGKAVNKVRMHLIGDDGLIPVEGSCEPVELPGGEVGMQGVFKNIRDLIRAEQEQCRAEERFQILFEASPSMISIANISDKKYDNVNSAFCKFHDKQSSDFIAQQTLGMSTKFKTNIFKQTIDALLHGKPIHEQNTQIHDADGSLRSLRSVPRLIQYEDGPRVMVVSTDVTPELELQKNNGILRATLESMHHGVSLYDEDLVLILSNNRCLDLLDLPREMGGAGTPFEDFMRYNAERGEYGPGDVDELVQERVLLAKQFKSHRFDRVRPDGTVVEIEGHFVPGVGFISTYMDITERVKAEDIVRESEKRLREIVDSLPFAFSLWDRDGRRVLGNSIWKEWYPEFYSLMPEIGEHFTELVRNFLKYGLVDPMPEDPEAFINERYLSLKNADENTQEYQKYGDRWLHMINKVMPSGDIATIRIDVTEQRKQEEQLRQAQKMEAVGQLTGGIAHDFNNMLSVILGNIEIIQEHQISRSDEIEPRLNAINRAANRGAELTQQLLSFSRKLELRPTVSNLNEVVRDMSVLLKSTLGEGVKLEINEADDLWDCFIDQGQFDNSLINMCINARDSISGNGRFCLWTKNSQLKGRFFAYENELVSGDFVKLTIADNGAGISEANIKQVFEPFFTTKEVGKGSGLGLSMVFGFVRQSGGHIAVKSKIGEGTRFEIYLPRHLA